MLEEGERVAIPLNAVDDEVGTTLLEVDYDGDGQVDVTYDERVPVVEEEAPAYEYEDLIVAIKQLGLNRPREKVLLNLARTADKFYQKRSLHSRFVVAERLTLKFLQQRLNVYRQLSWLSPDQVTELNVIIDELRQR